MISADRMKFLEDTSCIRNHFSSFAAAMARADADEKGLTGLARFLYVRAAKRDWLALRGEFTKRVIGESVTSVCEGRTPMDPCEILATLDCNA